MSVLLGAVLEESGYAESRASKMDVDDFLKYVHASPLLGYHLKLISAPSVDSLLSSTSTVYISLNYSRKVAIVVIIS